jgi:hypothetical protein
MGAVNLCGVTAPDVVSLTDKVGQTAGAISPLRGSLEAPYIDDVAGILIGVEEVVIEVELVG